MTQTLLSSHALEADDHLGRSAPSVAPRPRLLPAERQSVGQTMSSRVMHIELKPDGVPERQYRWTDKIQRRVNHPVTPREIQ